MQFTEKFIKALKAKEGQKKFYDVREKSGQGFGITVFPSGEKSFIFIYHYAGRKRRMTLGKYPHCTLADARRLHREALKMVENGKDPGLEKRKEKIAARDSSTVEGLIEEYIEIWAKPRKRSWEEDQRILDKDIRPIWGKCKAKDITRRDVIQLLDKIKERGAPIIANRTLACIRRMFNFAIERDLIQATPCAQVKAPSKENRRERCLSLNEVKIFWDGLKNAPMSEATRLALKFQLVTAQRKGEVISAEWSEIDLADKVWVISAEKAKNGLTHRVPLSGLAIELLNEIKSISNNSRWLFPSERKSTHIRSQSIDRALRRSSNAFPNLESFCPHDLRRSSITHMASLRISSEVLSRIANHAKKGVTELHYIKHTYDDEKRYALEAWSQKLKELLFELESSNNIVPLKNAM
jgi:integrase